MQRCEWEAKTQCAATYFKPHKGKQPRKEKVTRRPGGKGLIYEDADPAAFLIKVLQTSEAAYRKRLGT